jgi:hypothetical protein
MAVRTRVSAVRSVTNLFAHPHHALLDVLCPGIFAVGVDQDVQAGHGDRDHSERSAIIGSIRDARRAGR